MKERRDLLACWVNARKVWAFMSIAIVAGESQVGILVAATMLFRGNVLDVKCDAVVLLMNAAIFTTVVCSGTYRRSCFRIHAFERPLVVWLRENASFCLQDCQNIHRSNVSVVLGCFVFR